MGLAGHSVVTHCIDTVNGKRRLRCYWLAWGGCGVVAVSVTGHGDGVSHDVISHGMVR